MAVTKRNTLLRLIVALVTGAGCLVEGGLRDPFPLGSSMGNLGTIIWDDDLSGRQAWTPAAFLRDTLRLGFSAAGAWYYDPMDNLRESSIRQAAIGGWFRAGRARMKAAYSVLDALGIYYEQSGVFSVSFDFAGIVNAGTEVRGHAAGLWSGEEIETIASVGAAAWLPLRFAAVSFECRDILVAGASREGLDPPVRTSLGLHTVRHRFGAQGVLIQATGIRDPSIRIAVGEEYRPLPMLGVTAGLATNPLMIALGLVLEITEWGVHASAVYHPVLGWSKGTGFDWAGDGTAAAK